MRIVIDLTESRVLLTDPDEVAATLSRWLATKSDCLLYTSDAADDGEKTT